MPVDEILDGAVAMLEDREPTRHEHAAHPERQHAAHPARDHRRLVRRDVQPEHVSGSPITRRGTMLPFVAGRPCMT